MIKQIIFLIFVGVFVERSLLAETEMAPILNLGTQTLDNWRVEGEKGSQYQLALSEEEKKSVLKLDFDLFEGNWIQISQRGLWDLSNAKFARFQYRATGSANNLQFKVVDKDGSTFGINIPGALPSHTWLEMDIPFTQLQHFWGGDDNLDLSNIKRVYIAIIKSQGGKGSLLIDDLLFSENPSPSSGPEKGLGFQMESTLGWSIGGESGSSSNLGLDQGQVGRGLRIDYDFGSGTWIQLQYKVDWDLSEVNHIVLWARKEGERNDLQIKVVDDNKSTFGTIIKGRDISEDWQEFRIPFREFNHFWGGDNNMNWSNLRHFYFAFTKDDGGTGVFYLDQCSFFYEAMPDEVADEAKTAIQSIYSFEAIDVNLAVDKGKSYLNEISYAWDGLPSLKGPVDAGEYKDAQDVKIENVLKNIKIALQEDKDIESHFDFLVERFIDQGSGFPVWSLDESGQKKSYEETGKKQYLSPLKISLDLVKLLYHSRDILGDEKAKDYAQKIVPVLERALNEGFLMPLWIWEEGGEPRLAGEVWTRLDLQDPAAFHIIGQWLDHERFLNLVQPAIDLHMKAQSEAGLFLNLIRFTNEGPKLEVDRVRLKFQLIGNLNIAENLLDFHEMSPNEDVKKMLRLFLDRLMASWSIYKRIYTSYDSLTGVPLSNFESLVIYSKMVEIALGLNEFAIAEDIISEKILPTQSEEGSFLETHHGFEGNPKQAIPVAWTNSHQYAVLALLAFQSRLKEIDQEKLESYTIQFQTPKFLDKDYEVIYLEDLYNMDALSNFGNPDGNFDGVGFSFAAASFPPTHTLFYSQDESAVFLVPPKAGHENNAIQSAGQKVFVRPDRYNKLHLMFSAHHGNVDDTVTLIYEDGEEVRVPVSIGDWWHHPKGTVIGRVCDLVNNGQQVKDRQVNIFQATFELNPEKIFRAFSLPTNGKAVFFTASIEPINQTVDKRQETRDKRQETRE